MENTIYLIEFLYIELILLFFRKNLTIQSVNV
jgi:hypothetical protein